MITDIIKDITTNVIDNDLDINIVYGKVMEIEPIKISVSQEISLNEKNLVILNNGFDKIKKNDIVLILTLKGMYYLLGGVKN